MSGFKTLGSLWVGKRVKIQGDGSGSWWLPNQTPIKWETRLPFRGYITVLNQPVMVQLNPVHIEPKKARSPVRDFNGIGLGYSFVRENIHSFEMETIEFLELLLNRGIAVDSTVMEQFAKDMMCQLQALTEETPNHAEPK